MNEKDIAIALSDFQTEITLWASPNVLNSVMAFTGADSGTDGSAMMLKIDPIIRAMRKDIGLSNWNLDDHHFIRMTLSDPNELDDILSKQ